MTDKNKSETRPAIKLEDLLPKQPVAGAGTAKRSIFGAPWAKTETPRNDNKK